MVSFKDVTEGNHSKVLSRKVNYKEVKEDTNSDNIETDNTDALNNIKRLVGDTCTPGGRVVDYQTVIAPPVTPPGPTPSENLCVCLGDKLDQIDTDVKNQYDTGPSFNTGKLFTQAATPVQIEASITNPSPDPAIIGFYDAIPVAPRRNNLNATLIYVIADPDGAVNPNDPFLYVRTTSGPHDIYSVEVDVRVGEDFGFRDVYEFRIRASVAGQQYRITTDPHHTTFVSVITNVVPGSTVVTTPPTANRPAFTAQNISILLANTDQILPSIPIPNGFSLVVRSNPFNFGTSKIYVSSTDATIIGSRNTLAAGDAVRLYINNADLVHIGASITGQTVDIVVEQ